ncbi:hypothetical protein DPMN_101408 [Dreissena polymorpha]|uniref:Uncharacterized protein n=1 Tax=Dreissena polymorpha TaxID=45954 RepID=A0A9D4R8A7_DREPO|nr:hypothetical protein DPMN_101408 [Dreissena polymorpha]
MVSAAPAQLNANRCAMQCVANTPGTARFRRVTTPEFRQTITEAPSVLTPHTF